MSLYIDLSRETSGVDLHKPQSVPYSLNELPERFRSRIRVGETPGYGGTPCWYWTGANNGKGYGIFHAEPGDQGWVMAHRFAFEALVGSIPDGLITDHLCRVRACCNPAHIEPVTSRENTLRGSGPTAINARRLFCKAGHPLVGDNVYRRNRNGRPARECRACHRRWTCEWRAKKKAARIEREASQ